MQSTVWHTDLSTSPGHGLLEKTARLLYAAGLPGILRPGDLTAIKVHFGEPGNLSYVHPSFLRTVAEKVTEAGGKPFLTDTNTLYVGGRSNAVDHLRSAARNGFVPEVAGAPVIIADGLRGDSAVAVPGGGPLFREVSIGAEIARADALVAVTHFKGHELSGFGGTIKNLGMGCASRAGKLQQHSTVAPHVDPSGCVACGTCVAKCPSGAIRIAGAAAVIDGTACIGCADCIVVCPEGAVRVDWNEAAPGVQRKMAEYALGAVRGKEGKCLFLAFLTQISPYCDCYGNNDRPIAPDAGIAASRDPVALDQACVDLVREAAGEDPFRRVHPAVDWSVQLAHAQEIGLGTRRYRREVL